jgi:hypothetical protein
MLDRVEVASPCSERWEDMVGDAVVRHCASCDKNVYNLSGMPREVAEQLLAEHTAGNPELCVRFFRRADGTLLTADCPVGRKKKRRKKAILAIAGGGALAVAALSAMARSRCDVVGEMRPATMNRTLVNGNGNENENAVAMGTAAFPAVMGSVTADPPPPPPRRHEIVGRRAPPPRPRPKTR